MLRKRHIGNDVVNLVFLDHDAPPFDPSNFVSRFQFVFVVVRQLPGHLGFQVAVARQEGLPNFGPELPPSGVFDSEMVSSGYFRRFLMTMLVNAENAAYSAGRLLELSTRTRLRLLDDIVDSCSSNIPVVLRSKGTISKILSVLLSAKKKRQAMVCFRPFTPMVSVVSSPRANTVHALLYTTLRYLGPFLNRGLTTKVMDSDLYGPDANVWSVKVRARL